MELCVSSQMLQVFEDYYYDPKQNYYVQAVKPVGDKDAYYSFVGYHYCVRPERHFLLPHRNIDGFTLYKERDVHPDQLDLFTKEQLNV